MKITADYITPINHFCGAQAPLHKGEMNILIIVKKDYSSKIYQK